MKVRHPGSGVGVVRSIGENVAEIRFDDGTRRVSPETSDLETVEEQVTVSGLNLPLKQLIGEIVEAAIEKIGIDKPANVVDELAVRWHGGKLIMHPSDPTLQTKEVEIEAFFHKIVMMRNNLRTLEQKVNSNDKLSDSEKFDLQQYITRCYGSMTTFNAFFKNKEDQFNSKR